jgi:hypothetical protein
MQLSFFKIILLAFCFISMSAPVLCSANNIETDFGGQVKLSLSGTDYKNSSIHSEFKDDIWFDAGLNLRIKNRTFFNDDLSFDCHYVFTSLAGDSMEQSEYFSENYPGTFISQLFQRKFDDDDTKVMDLSSDLKNGDDYFFYHRIDRFNLNLESDLGRLTIGRQAVTWGNGLVFNPMDVVNPFSPYDTERDYKKGDDILHFETVFEKGDDLQFLYAPRRDSGSGNIKLSESSTAVKYHLLLSDYELDFMAARHYEDTLLGMGCIGTIWDAVWRSDVIYIFAGGDTEEDFFNIIVNIDYSWVWFDKNFYGFLEYHYSGLGLDDNYSESYTEDDLAIRTGRGEIYGLGKNYLSTSISIELSPLFNFNFTGIVNLGDPSYLIQPKITWSAAQNFEITLGANFAIGGKNEEYGFQILPSSTREMDYGSSAFLWATMFF